MRARAMHSVNYSTSGSMHGMKRTAFPKKKKRGASLEEVIDNFRAFTAGRSGRTSCIDGLRVTRSLPGPSRARRSRQVDGTLSRLPPNSGYPTAQSPVLPAPLLQSRGPFPNAGSGMGGGSDQHAAGWSNPMSSLHRSFRVAVSEATPRGPPPVIPPTSSVAGPPAAAA